MNFLKKIDHYLLTNHPVLWRTKVHYFVLFSLILGNLVAYFVGELLLKYDKDITLGFGIISSETKISLLFDGFFFRYFSLQKSLRSVGYARFL